MYSSAFCASVNISGSAVYKVGLGCSIIISLQPYNIPPSLHFLGNAAVVYLC